MKRTDNIILHLSDLHFSTKLLGTDKVNSDSVLEELTEILNLISQNNYTQVEAESGSNH